MFAGIDFPSKFDQDNFVQRRSVGNLFDPESLISGKEIAQGMTYKNSKRNWEGSWDYELATAGYMDMDTILEKAPRVSLPNRYLRSDERVR